jgi:RNA recognition motif-containing protein
LLLFRIARCYSLRGIRAYLSRTRFILAPVHILNLFLESSTMNIYVGNLAYSTNETDLREAFAAFGVVDSARVITDKFTGQAKGFAFVEMPNAAEAQAAIAGLDTKDLGGRALRVNESQPKEQRSSGGSYGGGNNRGGGNSRW